MAAMVLGRAAARLARKGMKKKAKKKVASKASSNVRKVGKKDSPATTARKKNKAAKEIANRNREGGYKNAYERDELRGIEKETRSARVRANKPRTKAAEKRDPFGSNRMTKEESARLEKSTKSSAKARNKRTAKRTAAATAAGVGAVKAAHMKSSRKKGGKSGSSKKGSFKDPRGR